jgi:hypothetical protein
LVREIVEVYFDDIVVKTRESNSLLENLVQVFDKLRATSTKLNPEKCVFGVSADKLLDFLVSHRGIEANPDKVREIEAMRPPVGLKDVQRLTGSLAALSRFISRLAERALPFFKLMRGSGPFAWTEEAECAFQEMKQYLTSLRAATAEVISMVLVTERSEHLPQGASADPPCRRRRSGLYHSSNRPYFGGSGRVPTRRSTKPHGVRWVPSSSKRIRSSWQSQDRPEAGLLRQ